MGNHFASLLPCVVLLISYLRTEVHNQNTKEKMEEEFIINYCRRDQVWLVCRRTARDKKMFITIAECFTKESAEILYRELTKDTK